MYKNLLFIIKPAASTYQPLCTGKFHYISKGIGARGITSTVIKSEEFASHHIGKDTLPVVWGISYIEELNITAPFLVLERGFLGNRTRFFSLGMNGLNGRADFQNENCSNVRWNSLFPKLVRPWNCEGDYVLLMGQNPTDTSIKHFDQSYSAIIENIRSNCNRPIVFKPHPNDRTKHRYHPDVTIYKTQHPRKASKANALVGKNEELYKLIDGSFCTVSINSNASVLAVLRGKPSIVLDRGAMAWDMCGHDCSLIERPFMPNREQWCNNLAHTQWTLDEIVDVPEVLDRFLK